MRPEAKEAAAGNHPGVTDTNRLREKSAPILYLFLFPFFPLMSNPTFKARYQAPEWNRYNPLMPPTSTPTTPPCAPNQAPSSNTSQKLSPYSPPTCVTKREPHGCDIPPPKNQPTSRRHLQTSRRRPPCGTSSIPIEAIEYTDNQDAHESRIAPGIIVVAEEAIHSPKTSSASSVRWPRSYGGCRTERRPES